MAGAVLAFAWAIRPLAVIYTVAIGAGIGVLLVRGPRRALTMRFAGLLLSTCAAGVFVQQVPAIFGRGVIAFENKNAPGRTWAEVKYLSRLKFEERGGSLSEWLKVPVLMFSDVAAYKAEHGAQALPSTRWQQLGWSPRRTIRDFVETLLLRDTFYFAGLLGILFPLAWMRVPSTLDAATGQSMFLGSVLIAYVVVLTLLTSPFMEWRWLVPPLCLVALRGAFALDRLSVTHARAVLPLAILQLLFLCASLMFWTSRVLRVQV